MKVTGSCELRAGRKEVWDALQDPAVLARTMPGCLQLERTGLDEYQVTVEAGVGSIRGVYTGQVRLSDQQPPERYVLRATGQGGPGTVDASASVRLEELDNGGTRVSYDADAVVGGMIGGVGQRMLVAVARRTATEFFEAVDDDLAGRQEPRAEPAAAHADVEQTGRVGEVFAAPPRVTPTAAEPATLFAAALAGALVALLGVLVGRRTAR